MEMATVFMAFGLGILVAVVWLVMSGSGRQAVRNLVKAWDTAEQMREVGREAVRRIEEGKDKGSGPAS